MNVESGNVKRTDISPVFYQISPYSNNWKTKFLVTPFAAITVTQVTVGLSRDESQASASIDRVEKVAAAAR